jgi:integrase
MASVIKRIRGGQTRWIVRWRGPDNTQGKKTFDRKVDADRYATSIDHSMLTGAYVDPNAGKITFKVYAEQWRALQVHRPTSAAHVETTLRRHAYPVFGDRALSSIRPSEIQSWIKGLTLGVDGRKALQPNTIGVTHGYVAAIFKSAIRDRKVTSSPCEGTKLPKCEPKQVVPRSTEVVRALAESVPERYAALVLLAAGTGLRQGEAFGLTLDRVDFLRRSLTVDRQLVSMPRKSPYLAPPKTAASYRTIPLPRMVVEALSEHVRLFPPGPDGFLFTTPKGEPLRRTAFSAKVWRPAAAEAGAAGVVFHELRHYYASLLIRHGESVKVVQTRLGHATAGETLDTYSHLWPDSEDQTRQAVDSVFDSSCAPAAPLNAVSDL